MNSGTQRTRVAGPAGLLECAIDEPAGGPEGPAGLALMCHPHPLHGGTMDNKVVQTLARAWTQQGYRSVRFNFRGVGGSEGAWDEGRGEVDDAMAVLCASALAESPGGEPPNRVPRLVLAGFSFGACIAAEVAARLDPPMRARLRHLVLVGPAVSRLRVPPVPAGTLVIHGETDDVVPLIDVLAWARPQALPVMVVPGAGHFFHGQLPLLKRLVQEAPVCQPE